MHVDSPNFAGGNVREDGNVQPDADATTAGYDGGPEDGETGPWRHQEHCYDTASGQGTSGV